jgi:hypothetical protein
MSMPVRPAPPSALASPIKSIADCDTAAELDVYGYKPATKATQTFSQVGTPANGVQVVSKHNDNAAVTATFNSTTGNIT